MAGLANPESPQPLRILLVDDHRMLREGVRVLLQQQADMDVVAEATDGHTALAEVRHHAPNIAVLDLGLPDMDGLELARRISRQAPGLRLVVLSAEGDADLLDQALEAGVSAYVLKADAVTQLVKAIRMVAVGKSYLSPELAALLVPRYKRYLAAGHPAEPELSEREREVLKRIAEGQSTKEIAHRLELSSKTIESHRQRLMTKLDRHSVAELTKYAIRQGLTSL